MLGVKSLQGEPLPDLEHVQNKMMSLMIAARFWIVILPVPVVDRNSHLLRVSMIEIFSAAHVGIGIKVLWIEDVRIVKKAIPIMGAMRVAPLSTKGLRTLLPRRRVSRWLLSIGGVNSRHNHSREQKSGHD